MPEPLDPDVRVIRTEERCQNPDLKSGSLSLRQACMFTGYVDVVETAVDGDGVTITGNRHWTCPVCGYENEERDVVLEGPGN